MRLVLRNIDRLTVDPVDLSDIALEGSPDTATLVVDGVETKVTPVKSASHDRPTGDLGHDSHFDLSDKLVPPCRAVLRWKGGTAWLSVVSYHYCTIDEILDYGNDETMSPRAQGHGEPEAFAKRNLAETVVDDICNATFRATAKVQHDVTMMRTHQLDWPASQVLDSDVELIGDSHVRLLRGRLCESRDVPYIAGRDDDGPPSDIREATAHYAASLLMASKVPERASSESTEAGTTRYTLADAGSTGIPDVDAVLRRHERTRLVI